MDLCRLAVTKLDILDVFDEIKVGIAYHLDGKKVETFPGITFLSFTIYGYNNALKYFTQDFEKITSQTELWLNFTASDEDLQKVKVEYSVLPGWKEKTENARKFSELPLNAQKYVEFIQDYLHVPG